MFKAYKYHLLPTDEQKVTLTNWMGACRFIYNLGLEVKKRAWESKINVSSYDLMKQVTELKRTECKWLAEVSGQSLESALTNLDSAYKYFFRGGGFPRFKKKASRQSIQFKRDSLVVGDKIRLTKLGFVDFVQHRPIGTGQIRTVTVSKTPTGEYFVSILIKNDEPVPSKKPVQETTAIGIDLGLKTFATLSNGDRVENPRLISSKLRLLKKEQRTLARRYKIGVKISEQSKGWYRQKLVVAKLYEKISNQRKDFLHKTSTAIVKQFDTVCLEDLNVAGMIKNRKLSKAVSDASWAEFVRMLEYKAEWYGKNIKTIGRFEPSSKTCSECGEINQVLRLSDREWACAKCGIVHDRDLNAAKNIKKLGLEAKPSLVNVGQKVKRGGCESMPQNNG